MKYLTREDFTADETGMYSSPLTSYTVQDQLHGVDSGEAIPSLLLLATDGETVIDAGLFHSWGAVFAYIYQYPEHSTLTQSEAVNQLVTLIKALGASNVAELCAQACDKLALIEQENRNDLQETAFHQAASFHFAEASAAIYAC